MKNSEIWSVLLENKLTICSVSSMDMGVIHGGVEYHEIIHTTETEKKVPIQLEMGVSTINVKCEGSEFDFDVHALNIFTSENIEEIDVAILRHFSQNIETNRPFPGPKNTTIKWGHWGSVECITVEHPIHGFLLRYYN